MKEAQKITILGTLMPEGVLPSKVAVLSIGVLQLGLKAKNLREHGIETIADLSSLLPIGYPNPYGLGHGSIRKLTENFSCLQQSVDENGDVSWERYSSLSGVALVPSLPLLGGAYEFLRTIPKVLEEISDILSDPTLADILHNRLAKKPGAQKTLEEIAADVTPKVTRERIRQREKKLLHQIAGGLIWDEYGPLNLTFRPEFSRWWRDAATYFESSDEISFEDFVSGLTQVWSAEVEDVLRQLPIILAIVTGEVQMSAEFRKANRLNKLFFGELPNSTKYLKLKKLRLEKTASQLSECGYDTIEEFVDGCLTGEVFDLARLPSKRAIDHLNHLKSVLNTQKEIDWKGYVEMEGLKTLPSKPRSSAKEFSRHLKEDLVEIIRNMNMYQRSEGIYLLRTSQPSETRKTLAATAEALNTHGPNVKRVESVLLERLNDVIIERDFSRLDFWLCGQFLDWWREAEAAFQISDNDYDTFNSLIQEYWSINRADAESAVPSLWVVLNGYPNGRPPRRKVNRKQQIIAEPAPNKGRIRLAGFRRVH